MMNLDNSTTSKIKCDCEIEGNIWKPETKLTAVIVIVVVIVEENVPTTTTVFTTHYSKMILITWALYTNKGSHTK